MAVPNMAAIDEYFSRKTFRFLQDLDANNNRDWFLANKPRYEAGVKEPFLRFITDFGPRLKKINSHFVADPRPNGGSMMRIYRDIRFSKDKSPYKSWLAAHFPHEDASRESQTPSFYLHLALDGCFAAGGMWRPDPVALKKVRDAIVAEPNAWRKVVSSHLLSEGESGSRPPKGYAADHPFIEDIKRKDFIASVKFTTKQVCGPAFIDEFAAACKSMTPLMQFLVKAVGVDW